MPSDELAARRWLRELFRKLGEQCPGLKTTEKREKLTAELERQDKEDSGRGDKR
jgi:hypothetical protein